MESWALAFIPNPYLAVATASIASRPQATSVHRPTSEDGWSACRGPSGRETMPVANQVSVGWGVLSSVGAGEVRPVSAWPTRDVSRAGKVVGEMRVRGGVYSYNSSGREQRIRRENGARKRLEDARL